MLHGDEEGVGVMRTGARAVGGGGGALTDRLSRRERRRRGQSSVGAEAMVVFGVARSADGARDGGSVTPVRKRKGRVTRPAPGASAARAAWADRARAGASQLLAFLSTLFRRRAVAGVTRVLHTIFAIRRPRCIAIRVPNPHLSLPCFSSSS